MSTQRFESTWRKNVSFFCFKERAAASADTHLSVSGHYCCAPALAHWPTTQSISEVTHEDK